MKVVKLLRSTFLIATFAVTVAALSGCGGVSEAQLAELRNLRAEVNSLEAEANALKEERARLERDIAEKNAKLEQCAKEKEEAKANLEKLPK